MIYLAGPISGLTFEQSNTWRKEMEDNFPGQCLNPLLEKDKKELDDNPEENAVFSDGKALGNIADQFFMRDIYWVDKCSIMLANFTNKPDQLGGGTVFEIGYAKGLRTKRVIVVGPKENITLFVIKSADIHFETLAEAIVFLKETYVG